jgi:outer membrane protein
MTLQNDIDTLKNDLGLKPEDTLEVTGKLDIDDKVVPTVVTNAMGQDTSANLGVAAATNTLATAKVTATRLFNSNYLPSLAITGKVTPTYPISSKSSSTVSSSLSAVVSVALDNYMPWSSAHEKVAGANDTVKSGQSALSDAVKTTQVSRMSDKRSAESYQSTLGVLRMNVDLTQRTYDATKAAYDKGLETMTNLLSAAGDLESAQLNALSKSYDLIAALLELQYETGIPLDTTGRF